MSEVSPPYGTTNRSLKHGAWEVRWEIYPDDTDPIVLSIESPDGSDEWAAITVSLTHQRAVLLRHALELALTELGAINDGIDPEALGYRFPPLPPSRRKK